MVIRKMGFDTARTISVLFAASEESVGRVTYVGRVTAFLWINKFIHDPNLSLPSLLCLVEKHEASLNGR